MEITSFQISATKLKLRHLIERRSQFRERSIPRDLDGLRFHVTKSAKLLPAGFAFGDGVVGRIVGTLDNGAPTFEALKLT